MSTKALLKYIAFRDNLFSLQGILNLRKCVYQRLRWWLHDPVWPGWNPVPFCWDPGSIFINYILRLHVKSFIPARRDPSFVLLESCFAEMKFSNVIASSRISGMNKLVQGLFIWRWADPVRRASWDDFYSTFIWNLLSHFNQKFVMLLEKDFCNKQWRKAIIQINVLILLRACSYGGELARLSGLARLSEISPSLRNSYKNIMYSYEKWASPPRWDVTCFCRDPT